MISVEVLSQRALELGSVFEVLSGELRDFGPAILLIPHADVPADDALVREAREAAEGLRALSHRTLPVFYGAGELGGRPFLAFEPIGGTTLSRALPLPHDLAAFVVEEIADLALALERAGAPALELGAIEPTRVRLTSDGGVKVLGVGLESFRNHVRSRRATRVGAPGAELPPVRVDASLERLVRAIVGERIDPAWIAADATGLAKLAAAPRADRTPADMRRALARFLERPPERPVAALFDFDLAAGAPAPDPARPGTALIADEGGVDPEASEPDPSDPASIARERTEPSASGPRGGFVEPDADEEERRISAGPDEDLTGQVLNGYKVGRVIGRGGTGVVYHAEHQFLPLVCAVKVLNGRYAASEHMRRRMLREARALVGVRHPNVLRILDYGETPSGRPFLMTEVLDGASLRDRLRADPTPDAGDVLEWMQQLAEGLAALHSAGVIHRDLKPSNIYLSVEYGREVLKIIDLGLVRWVEPGEFTQLTRADQVLGTPAYMAPEQVSSPSKVGPEADLYAAGAILYEMLVGKPPFLGQRILERKQFEDAPVLAGTSGLEELASALLDRDPAKRPTAAMLVSSLARVVRTRSTMAPRTAEVTVSRQASWRSAVVALIGAFVLGSVAGGLALSRMWTAETPVAIAAVPTPIPDAVRAVARPAPEAKPAPSPAPTPEPRLAIAPVEPEEPEPPPPPKKGARPPARRHEKAADPDRTEARLAAARADLRTVLARDGYTEDDLPMIAAGAQPYHAWREALAARDADRAERALTVLLADVRGTKPDRRLLGEKLRRIREGMVSAKRASPDADLHTLEDRYFALTRELRTASTGELPDILRRASDLERDLRALR